MKRSTKNSSKVQGSGNSKRRRSLDKQQDSSKSNEGEISLRSQVDADAEKERQAALRKDENSNETRITTLSITDDSDESRQEEKERLTEKENQRWDQLEDEERRSLLAAQTNEHEAETENVVMTNVNNQRLETETDAIKRKQDEEISACFEAAKQKLGRLLKSKKQIIKDLARELERLGRPVDHIAAEIVHELSNCEELSRSQIYSYLDDKYKNQTQAQRRKGKKESNPDPKTGTESPSEQTITIGNNGQQTTSNEHDAQEHKKPADTPAESVTSNQQSNPANLQKSDWNPDPKTGTESLSPEQGTIEQSANTNTNTSKQGSMTAPPTSPQSIDTLPKGEDSMCPETRDKSPLCENCSAKDIRIEKLVDENRELDIRCHRAESSNNKLVLQLIRQGKYINEFQDRNMVTSNNSKERISSINQLEETPTEKENTSYTSNPDSDKHNNTVYAENTELKEALSRQTTFVKADEISDEIELTIPKANLEEAMQKSRESVYVVFDESGMFERAIPDIFGGK
jgi:hypothetical protein